MEWKIQILTRICIGIGTERRAVEEGQKVVSGIDVIFPRSLCLIR